jgi:hypothetical protein
MAQHDTIDVVKDVWTQITNADVTAITFQNLTGGDLWIKGTTSAVAPTDLTDAIVYSPNEGEANVPMADLFPGLGGADRVYVYTQRGGWVFVSHA